MKFYSYILVMKRDTFLILAIMIGWIGMVLRTFFWWINEKSEIKEDHTWFIDKIVETWNIETTTKELPIEESTWTKRTNEIIKISVMMPRFFYTEWWKNFAQDLYEAEKVYMDFTFTDNLNEYRDTITSKLFSDADLALIPYDRMEYMHPDTFSFQRNINTDFDEMVSSVVDDSKISFLPFAVDPMVMYTLTGNDIYTNFADILDFVYDWTPTKNLSFPIFFWLTAEDEDNEWFVWEYQDIVRYALMHYFTKYSDTNSLEQWIETNLLEKYKLSTLNTIIKKISDQNCDNFPSICMQLYNYVTIRFWFLSDKDVVKQYFSAKKSEFDGISRSPVPFSYIESPFRLWGWVIPSAIQNKDKQDGIYAVLVQYMKKHTEYPLWNSTLSVFVSSSSNLMDNEFIWARWYFLQWWWKFLDVVRDTRPFRQMLGQQLSAREYLRL